MQPLGKEESQQLGFRGIEQTVGSVGIWSFIAATFLAAFYLATSLYISSHRLLWIDEILTVLNTRLPDWTTIWKVSTQGVDGLRLSTSWSSGYSTISLGTPTFL